MMGIELPTTSLGWFVLGETFGALIVLTIILINRMIQR